MYILFDIGGTKMRLAGSQNGRSFSEPIILRTPKRFAEGIALFTRHARLLAGKERIIAIAGGVAGPMDPDRNRLVNAPNLKQWAGRPIRHELTKALRAPVYINNDAAIVGLGEALWGAGKGKDIVAYMTISTGVNGVRITHGHIEESTYGYEIGHQIICGEKKVATLEELIGGRHLQRKFHVHPREIKRMSIWNSLARSLAYGINNTIMYWSPDIVVLGGSMMKIPGIPIDEVRKQVNRVQRIFPKTPKIVKAKLGDIGGLYGAMEYLKQSIHSQ